jgi:mRNA interferase RelE/StbE
MYKLIISESALKQLKKIQKTNVKRIESAIDALSENPRPSGCKKLQVSTEDLYKIKIVDIRQIGHRKDIYR